jgi:deoxyhypusine synthase
MMRTGSSPDRFDLKRLRMYPLGTRKSLVSLKEFAKPVPVEGVSDLFDSLPEIYAGRDLKRLIEAIVAAHRSGRLVGVALGAHVVKCGLSPLINELIQRGIINAVAMSGATAIHDYEISLVGRTSEDVAEGLIDGRFGMAQETCLGLAKAATRGARGEKGLGRALGELILKGASKFKGFSILATATQKGIPTTVHVAIGTDITHTYPKLSGQDLGAATLIDFRKLVRIISGLERGVWLNVGSAVLLPEVFLKALSAARNLGYKIRNFTTANLDMIQHYRPRVNVILRPGGEGIALTGHHEILIPLLRAGILSALSKV